MKLGTIQTPALILDKARMEANIQRLRTILKDKPVRLRPHLKTCKSIEVAKRLTENSDSPITVSTLAEAEYFLDGGYTDILYAVSITPQKLPRVKALQIKGANITLLLDNLETALNVARIGEELETTFPCLIEIDCDGKRAGLDAEDTDLIPLAQCLHEKAGSSLAGVMTHAGGSYYCKSISEIEAMAEQERACITRAASRIQDHNLPCPVVSMGSTPTVTFAHNFEGITEVRAGVYVFQDMVMEALGVCILSDIAISVLATVISHKKDQNRILIDAGGLALSSDPGKKNTLGHSHFGQVCSEGTCTPYENLWIDSTNQEHGLISLNRTSHSFEDFPIGSRIRILPNHACMTAGAYDGYHVLDGGNTVTAYWERCNRW
ncbi:MAG: alanine racemase [Sneathiella sp.]